MQLSLIEQFPEVKKSIFLDVFAHMAVDIRTRKPTLIPLHGQRVPAEFKIRCLRKTIEKYPEGTVFKLDVKLVDVNQRKPFFVAVCNNDILRAIEFFDHNLRIQKGLAHPPEPTKIKSKSIASSRLA